MGINKTVSKARLDTALANGTIKENDITFVKDTENYEGIVVGNGDNPLKFPTVPSSSEDDAGKILCVSNNGIPKWNTIEEKSTFDGSKTITENLNLGGSLNVTGAVTAQSMTLGSSPTTSSDNMQVPTTAWVNNKLNNKADINSPAFTGTPTAPTPASVSDNSGALVTTKFLNRYRDEVGYLNEPGSNFNWEYNGQIFRLGIVTKNITINAASTLPVMTTPNRVNHFLILANITPPLTITLKLGSVSSVMTIAGDTGFWGRIDWHSFTINSVSTRENYKNVTKLSM